MIFYIESKQRINLLNKINFKITLYASVTSREYINVRLFSFFLKKVSFNHRIWTIEAKQTFF